MLITNFLLTIITICLIFIGCALGSIANALWNKNLKHRKEKRYDRQRENLSKD